MNEPKMDRFQGEPNYDGLDLTEVNFSGFADFLSKDSLDGFLWEMYDLLESSRHKREELVLNDLDSASKRWLPEYEQWLGLIERAEAEANEQFRRGEE